MKGAEIEGQTICLLTVEAAADHDAMVIFLASTIAQQAFSERFHFISSPVPRVSDAWE